nr:hypothetical protein NeseNPV-TR_ORF80 [Neodiprion sertifer nucleopolyhedrovirus]
MNNLIGGDAVDVAMEIEIPAQLESAQSSSSYMNDELPTPSKRRMYPGKRKFDETESLQLDGSNRSATNTVMIDTLPFLNLIHYSTNTDDIDTLIKIYSEFKKLNDDKMLSVSDILYDTLKQPVINIIFEDLASQYKSLTKSDKLMQIYTAFVDYANHLIHYYDYITLWYSWYQKHSTDSEERASFYINLRLCKFMTEITKRIASDDIVTDREQLSEQIAEDSMSITSHFINNVNGLRENKYIVNKNQTGIAPDNNTTIVNREKTEDIQSLLSQHQEAYDLLTKLYDNKKNIVSESVVISTTYYFNKCSIFN